MSRKSVFGLSCNYKIPITRNTDNTVLNKDNAINNAKIKINAIECYVPHFTPSIPQLAMLSKQILNKVPTELQYVERSVFMKKVNTQNLWTFELGTQEGVNVLIWIIIGFQQRKRRDLQSFNNETYIRSAVTSAQFYISMEKYPESAILLNYSDDDYSQGYCQSKEALRALTKNDIFKPYISDSDFRSSHDDNDIGYN